MSTGSLTVCEGVELVVVEKEEVLVAVDAFVRVWRRLSSFHLIRPHLLPSCFLTKSSPRDFCFSTGEESRRTSGSRRRPLRRAEPAPLRLPGCFEPLLLRRFDDACERTTCESGRY